MTTIQAKKDLYNNGKCFSEGKKYTVSVDVKTEAGLMERSVINDLNEVHTIGGWWREFVIITD